MAANDNFSIGRDRGIGQGERMSDDLRLLQIVNNAFTIRDLMQGDGFDADAADRIVRLAGHIAGLAQTRDLSPREAFEIAHPEARSRRAERQRSYGLVPDEDDIRGER